MIRRIEALNYRCLRYVNQALGSFHVLVGPNASGKTTFLDTLAFLSRLVSDGLQAAMDERTNSFLDLVWGREGGRLELAIEVDIPQSIQDAAGSSLGDTLRYEIAVGLDDETGQVGILREQIWLLQHSRYEYSTPEDQAGIPGSLFLAEDCPDGKPLISRFSRGDLEITPEPEVHTDAEGRPVTDAWYVSKPSAFRAVLERLDPHHFPASTWLRDLLARDILHIELINERLRKPSPPGKGSMLQPDGSNLPWVVAGLQERAQQAYKDWLAHLQTALPDLTDIRVVERPEDRHKYFMTRFRNGLEVPSWMLSDGTLHLLALTVIPYLPEFDSVCLVEEPENSIHPLNVETVMQSLSSVYDGQVLVATHSPAILAMIDAGKVLVFSRDENRGTSIIRGDEHPRLRDWKGEVSLGTLFAGGVLG